jgi:predicted transcriptional regulator
MSDRRVLDALVSLGLSQTDAKVYIYLASKGPRDAENIAEALGTQECLLREALENLKRKGIVTFSSKQSKLFFALSFNKALDMLIKAHAKWTREIEKSKNEILLNWRTMIDEGKS